MKSDRNSCVKSWGGGGREREKFKAILLPHLCKADHSQHEQDVNVRLWVFPEKKKLQKWLDMVLANVLSGGSEGRRVPNDCHPTSSHEDALMAAKGYIH